MIASRMTLTGTTSQSAVRGRCVTAVYFLTRHGLVSFFRMSTYHAATQYFVCTAIIDDCPHTLREASVVVVNCKLTVPPASESLCWPRLR